MAQWSSQDFQGPIPDLTGDFHIDSPVGVDIWDKPPSTHSFSAPFIYQSIPLSRFERLQVTVTSEWTGQYDQGGIILVARSKNGSRERWIKSGVELLDGVARVGTVAKDEWADWSLAPVTSKDGKTATIEFEAGPGKALWVRSVEADGTKVPLREVTWWAALDEDVEVRAGVFAARQHGDAPLRVHFKDLKVVAA